MSAVPVGQTIRNLLIEVNTGSQRRNVFQFAQPVVKIGRSSENDIDLNDGKVSRRHVEIHQQNGSIIIMKVSDKNQMMVNGQITSQHIVNSNLTLIRVGDSEIRIKTDLFPQAALAVVGAPMGPGAGALSTAGARPPAYPPHGGSGRPSSGPQFSQTFATPEPESKRGLLIIIVVLVLGGLWLFSGGGTKSGEVVPITSEEVEANIEATAENIKALQKEAGQKKDSIEYETAQQHYIKGFRDYKQGQYSLAITSFQAALAFYPQHLLAQKYLTLSRKKLEEMVRAELQQGIRYKDLGNLRMCVASFRKVLTMVGDPKDQNYRQAYQFKTECELMKKVD